MTIKLNQIIAITAGKKSRTQKVITEVHHQLQKTALLDGISRSYKPKDEDGERFPSEIKHVQLKVSDAINKVENELIELFDVVATQDWANCQAKANIVVNNKIVAEKIPVTYLLFLEKQLVDIHTFIEKLPTLDPAETWKFNKDTDCFSSDSYSTTKTKKILKNHVKYEATKEHPAQVETYSEDVVVGYWATTKFSGAIEAKDKNDMLERVRILQESVKCAREEANSIDVADQKIGDKILTFIFGN